MSVPTTRILAKPHVKQFIVSKFLEVDGLVRIPANDMLFAMVGCCLTDDPKDRFRGYAGSKFEEFGVCMPTGFRNSFLSASLSVRLARLLDDYFWREAELFIYRILHDQKRVVFKDQAIHLFYETYHITESQYPIGHFRRQMTRRNVSGARAEQPIFKDRISYQLTKEQCMQVWRLYHQKKVSCRVIAKHYGINHQTVLNISQKINAKHVQKLDES